MKQGDVNVNLKTMACENPFRIMSIRVMKQRCVNAHLKYNPQRIIEMLQTH